MSEAQIDATIFGAHEFRFVPPDEIEFVIRGVMNDSEAEAYLDFLFTHADKSKRILYSAYDLSGLDRVSEGARKRVINVGRKYPFAAMAVVGAGFSTRMLAGMIMRAGAIVSSKNFGFPHKFFDTMEEANAWFDELRRKSARP